ncbi:hypothetical protein CROQUDRAFT_85482 [Cronartium quercuum f. sp. fusiforme G11]|uniref:Uncharacterized protein n=1 Tax=Cronartium quercuum f. sp. fusiforme G11 TaxID=708437 RepID=A0A9P6NS36_9BASI|nr:hypothetical protein CROQUDRAFT_85482 [Cronartium quercuum f. sp. fusiforme G11]
MRFSSKLVKPLSSTRSQSESGPKGFGLPTARFEGVGGMTLGVAGVVVGVAGLRVRPREELIGIVRFCQVRSINGPDAG